MKLHHVLAVVAVMALGISAMRATTVVKQGSVGGSAQAMEALVMAGRDPIDVSLDKPEYSGERKWLYAMYQTALAHKLVDRQAQALQQLVSAALQEGDFNMALLAADRGISDAHKVQLLQQIVDRGIQTKDGLCYAALAVTRMPLAGPKEQAMEQVITAYINGVDFHRHADSSDSRSL
ncbi:MULTISPECIES: hypothetical protein [Ferrimonas]|uniref:hypothetical protein n=1 Tax=Ferrimonas TaxID=44011 RepID=UPI000489F36A|nr:MULTISPECIES: hypothetical protein [Ferrimonas]USD39034.1 hypothetical protein J8Z22_08000 [Ferrimonas sp. SCSIO 43195]